MKKIILFLSCALLFACSQALALNIVNLQHGYFPDSTRGRPIANGSIYVGVVGQDPEEVVNQKQVTLQQEDGSLVVVSQPIDTSAGGVPIYNGSPVTMLVSGQYSLKVLDSYGIQAYYVFNSNFPEETKYPDYSLPDQGATETSGTIAYYIAQANGDDATIHLRHDSGSDKTEYDIFTPLVVPANINLVFEKGAVLEMLFGASATFYSSEVISSSANNKIFTGTGGTFVFQNFSEIPASWYEGTFTNIGAVINEILTSNSTLGASITLPGGRAACSTPINLDLLDVNAVLKIKGIGARYTSTPALAGTYIDGSLMTFPVIKGGLTKNRANVQLSDFILEAGTAEGIQIGDASTAFTVSNSTYENLTVFSGTIGFDLQSHEGSTHINQIYAYNCSDTGINLENNNAVNYGSITAKGVEGSYAIKILDDKACTFSSISVDTNEGGALNISGDIDGLVISSLWLNNNNTDGTASYGVLVGDNTLSNADPVGVEFLAISLNPPNTAYSTAQLAVNRGDSVSFGPLSAVAGNEPLFSVFGDYTRNIKFKGWSLLTDAVPTIDLSVLDTDDTITLENCNIVDDTHFTWPTAATRTIVGGTMFRNTITADGKAANTYGPTLLNSASNKVDTTLADGVLAGEQKTVIMGNSTNASTFTVAHHDLGDGGSYTFDALGEAVQLVWTGVAWGEVVRLGGLGAFTP